uniref:Neurotransmitter-gated ion-channel ligand-binding domain-containing protein n=1 Tax=Magallana gigas TaxID=29159 RepID=K1S473_MAGGI
MCLDGRVERTVAAHYQKRILVVSTGPLIDIASGASVEEYKLLQSTLLTNYSTSVRPLLDQDDTVFVYSGFYMYLAVIHELDAVNQRLITTGFLELSWDDEFLQLHHRKSERKVGVFYRGVVKVERFLRCTTCNESRKVSGEKNMEVSHHDDDDGIINWTDVSSAINFVSFLTMLWFEITAMTIIITTLIGGVL